ncbi:MAG: stalk domain-containing protein [Bacillota bacterium]|nr:stalk domain-containing protein [Bacillota bacterium]
MIKVLKKPLISIFSVIALLVCINCLTGYAEDNSGLKTFVDQKEVQLESDPGAVDLSGVTYFPMYRLCKALGVDAIQTSKSGDTYKLTCAKTKREIILSKGNRTVIINGNTVQVDFDMIQIASKPGQSDVIMIPLRYVVEQLGGEVNVYPESKSIYVNSYKPIQFKDKAFETAVREIIKKPEGDIFKFDVDSVLVLDLSGKGITTVDELKYFESLTYLNVSNNNISDLSALKSLKGLSALFVKNNAQDLDFYTPIAAYFDNIKQCDFTLDIKFADKNLESFIKSQVSKSTGRQVDKLTAKDLLAITSLDASKQKILSIAGIKYLANLKTLTLNNNGIIKIDELGNLTNLETLKLSGNAIVDISSIGKLTNLVNLDLSSNQINDISSLSSLTKLNVLNLHENKIVNAAPINTLINLKEFYIDTNLLTDTCGLEKLMYLTKFYIVTKNNIPKAKLSVFNSMLKQLGSNTDITLPTPTPTITPTPTPTTSSQKVIRFYVGKSTYTVDGKQLDMGKGVVPTIKNGRTGVPVRFIADNIGAQAAWNATDRKITITFGKKVMDLWVNVDYALIDGKMTKMDVAPFIVSDRTLVPLRFVSENFGLETKWDGSKGEITIIYKY